MVLNIPHGTQDNPMVLMISPHSTEHPPRYSRYPPTFIMVSPTVLNTPHGTQDIPHGTHDIPHGTEHPHGTAHTLYRVVGEVVHVKKKREGIFECGKVIVFWRTDVLSFNQLKVPTDVADAGLVPRTKIKGKFSAEKRNNDNVIYLVDPNWKNSSMNYAHDLRDVHVGAGRNLCSI